MHVNRALLMNEIFTVVPLSGPTDEQCKADARLDRVESLGRYELIRRIAAGGMAEVWEGVIATGSFRRRVAIKRMFSDSAAPGSFERMFLDEARIASQLHHANIVSILDFGTEGGAPFQVLEYVEGADAERLRELGVRERGAFPLELALHICAEIGHALHYAHEARGEDGQLLGIVHRDVSPQNVLISWEGDVKLSDFGIALSRGRMEKTTTGMIKGKLAYMSPEQATGGEVDRRTDVFALGCVLHMLIAGKSPLAGENRMTDLLTGVELPIDGAVPQDVREIIAQAIRRSKHDRFETARELAMACGKALAPRIDVDARTALRSWVEGLRERTQLEMAQPDAPTAPGSSEVPTRPARVLSGQRADPAFLRTLVPQVPPGIPARRGRRTAVVSGGALLGGLLVAGAWYSGLLRRTSPATEVPGPARAAEASPPPSKSVEPPATTVAAQRPTEDASGKAVIADEAAQPGAAGPRLAEATRPPARVRSAEPKRPRESGAAETGEGVLEIGGAGALRGEIFVDDKSVGYAPKDVELPAGDHSVYVTTQQGRKIGPRRMKITTRHTMTSPLRWQIDDGDTTSAGPSE
jgi:serine/threonine protein kinase